MASISVNFKGSNTFQQKINLVSGTIRLHFGNGVHHSGYTYKQLAMMLSHGFSSELDGRDYEIPARPIFAAFTKEYKEDIIQIIKNSYTLHFKRVKANEQFTIAANEIRTLAVTALLDGNVPITPDNAKTYKAKKGNLPPWVFTGELVESLEAEYVRK